MSRIREIMILAITLFFAAVPGLVETSFAQTPPHQAFSKDFKPSDPLFVFTNETFNCTADDTFTLEAGTSFTLNATTVDGTKLLSTYSCLSWFEEGPEVIYQLDVTADLELFAGLRDLNETDLDIFLLSGCDTETCLTGDNTEFTIQLVPGTYYLVVDSYGTSENLEGSTFTLLLECRWLGIPDSVCLEDGSTAVTCATSIIPMEAQMFEKPNLVQSYACSPSILRGGEHWFAISLEATHGFTVSTTYLNPAVDQGLWLFDSCGADALCLGFADDKNSGQGETLSFTNDLETPVTVYLATDSFRAVDDEFQGSVSLEFSCQSFVATVPVNMGSVRSYFR